MASINPSNIAAVQGGGGLELLVVEVDKLVSLPDIYYRLEETIVDPTSTMEVIANLLRSDPDLCARMLRMANSAFYSFPTRIETIERAVGTIGLRQIRELVLITAVVKAFEGIPPGTVNMETFWGAQPRSRDHGARTGPAGRAAKCRRLLYTRTAARYRSAGDVSEAAWSDARVAGAARG